MRLGFQLSLAILIGLGTLFAGALNLYSPPMAFSMFYGIDITSLGDEVRMAIETQTRLLAGMWFVAGVFVLLSVRTFEQHTFAIRLVLIGLAFSSVGELMTVFALQGDVLANVFGTSIQIGVCLMLEVWRSHLIKVGKEKYV